MVVFLDVPLKPAINAFQVTANALVINNTVEQLEDLYNKRYPIYKANSSLSVNADKTLTR